MHREEFLHGEGGQAPEWAAQGSDEVPIPGVFKTCMDMALRARFSDRTW